MVDQSDVNRIGLLFAEFNQIKEVLEIFDKGGKIVSMSVVVPSATGQPVLPTTVSTTDIDYPEQMVASIESILSVRQSEIFSELTNLGITGIEQPVTR